MKETQHEKLKKAEQRLLGVGEEPRHSGIISKISLIHALNYYSSTQDEKTSKKWTIEWLKKNDPKLAVELKDLKDYEFLNYGFQCRVMSRGGILPIDQLNKLIEGINNLRQISKPAVISEEPQPTIKKEIRPAKSINQLTVYLEEKIDDSIIQKKPANLTDLPDATIEQYKETCLWLMGKKADLELNAEFYQPKTAQVLTKFYQSTLTLLQKKYDELQSKPVMRAVRKPRVAKIKTPEQIAKDVKFCKGSTELNLSGLVPAKMVGQRRAIVYDVKNKKLMFFSAIDQDGFTFQGTTLMNYDPGKSFCKNVRKPDELFAEKTDATFIDLKFILDKINAVAKNNISGRFNDSMLILKTSKSK